MKTVVVIPARLQSTRLPRKILLDICGKSMIWHVYHNVIKAKNIDAVYIAVDDMEVFDACKQFTDNVIMTSTSHVSGTDRLAEAIETLECDNVINVQGDEPLIDVELIETLAEELNDKSINMVSAMHRIDSLTELKSYNSVKVVVDNNSNALYFSRSIIPLQRDSIETILTTEKISNQFNFFKHIGIYGYKKDFLEKYSKLKVTNLESLEKLEQLRVLENGYKIKMVETNYKSIGVDTQEDLEKVREIIKCQ